MTARLELQTPPVGMPAGSAVEGAGVLARYAMLSTVALAANHALYLRGVSVPDAATLLFVVAVALTGPIPFALAGLAPAFLIGRLRGRWAMVTSWIVAVIGTSAMHVLLFSDRLIHAMYGFHLNGFVWNILKTPGGLESLNSSSSTTVTTTLIVLGFVAVQVGLLVVILKVPRIRELGRGLTRKRFLVAGVLPVVALFAGEKCLHGVSRVVWHGPVLAAANAFPLYVRVDFSRPARMVGIDVPRREDTIRLSDRALNYPLAEIRRDPAAPKYNIVWLCSESWRADMLDPGIMPAASAFAGRSVRFRQHYSGGNGTRMGVFSMFYGLYGTYWQPFLDQNRQCALMDLLQREDYQVDLYTSARFSYPEMNRTAFARVPAEHLHEAEPDLTWKRDRATVGRMLDFIDHRDPSRPFMTFLFYESPHAGYQFPDECEIRKEHAPEMNYLTMDLKHDIGLVKNRYINCCRHLDTQMERVLVYLEQHDLLKSTIVILTGDHGEEFMEKGRWGHNSAFSEEQVRTPLVLWVPGLAPAVVDRMTAHLDIPVTLMTLLGVKNPPSDYSLGVDLLGGAKRDYTVITHWDHIAYVDGDYKVELSLKPGEFVNHPVTTRDDAPVADRNVFFVGRRDRLIEVMREINRFKK